MDIKPSKKSTPTKQVPQAKNPPHKKSKSTLSRVGSYTVEHTSRRKIRQIIKRQKRSADKAVEQFDQSVDQHFLRRMSRLARVRRFVFVWLALAILLIGGTIWQTTTLNSYYLESSPVAGGVYREGVIGQFTNSNPIYATDAVDLSVSRLLYSSLFIVNGDGTLSPRLATSYTLDETQKIYTVDLRQDVRWQDGEEFTADDVVFTYKTIQNPDTRSPLFTNWRSVKVNKINDYKVQFVLPNIFSSFHYSLTNGIVPEHLLGGIDSEDLRSVSFNTTKPIGTGEFVLESITVSDSDDTELRSERVVLLKNDNYFGTEPKIDSVVIRTYRNEDAMIEAFNKDVIQSMVGLDSIRDDVLSQEDVRVVTAPLTSSVMTFYNNSNSILSDVVVRQALTHAVDVSRARESLEFDPIPVDSPFLRSQPTYDSTITQLDYDKDRAMKLLDDAGWVINSNGIREKEGKTLTLRLFSQSLGEYSDVIRQIQSDWAAIGVQLNVFLQNEQDIQTGAIARHDYDVLVYGISIGYDPDVFAYWHSSQIDSATSSGLNLSEFSNDDVDEALEAGRTRNDLELRSVKYEPFLEEWRKQAPAFGIYQPRFTMVVRGTFTGFDTSPMRSSVDRFRSVAEWKVRNAKVPKQQNSIN